MSKPSRQRKIGFEEHFKYHTANGMVLLCIFSRLCLSAQAILIAGASLGAERPAIVTEPLATNSDDRFKTFMSSPPNLEEIKWYKLALAPGGNVAHAANHPAEQKVTGRSFFARWQPDCLFLKSLNGLAQVVPGFGGQAEIQGRRGNSYWMVDPAGTVNCWEDSTSAGNQLRSSPARAFHWGSSELAEVLNMGVMHMEIGAAKWTGDSFIAHSYIPELNTPVVITGRIAIGRDHSVTGLRVRYKSNIAVWDYVIRYTYDTNSVLPFFPRRIDSFFCSGDVECEMAEWRVLSLKTSATRLEQHLFTLPASVTADRSRVLYYTNGAWYARNAIGQLAMVSGSITEWKTGAQTSATRNSYYVAIVLLTLLAFAFVLKANKKQTTQVISRNA